MTRRNWWVIAEIFAVLFVTVVLGFPAFHYAAALMIGVTLRHRAAPGGLLAPVDGLPFRTGTATRSPGAPGGIGDA